MCVCGNSEESKFADSFKSLLEVYQGSRQNSPELAIFSCGEILAQVEICALQAPGS